MLIYRTEKSNFLKGPVFVPDWIRTSKGVEPADCLYASIQAEAISRSAVFQIQWAGAYELVELSLEAQVSHRCGRETRPR